MLVKLGTLLKWKKIEFASRVIVTLLPMVLLSQKLWTKGAKLKHGGSLILTLETREDRVYLFTKVTNAKTDLKMYTPCLASLISGSFS